MHLNWLAKTEMRRPGRHLCLLITVVSRAYERGFRGYIVPGPGGPGLRGPGRVGIVASSFGPNFFASLSFNQARIWAKMGLNLSEDLFIFALHLILGKK